MGGAPSTESAASTEPRSSKRRPNAVDVIFDPWILGVAPRASSGPASRDSGSSCGEGSGRIGPDCLKIKLTDGRDFDDIRGIVGYNQSPRTDRIDEDGARRVGIPEHVIARWLGRNTE